MLEQYDLSNLMVLDIEMYRNTAVMTSYPNTCRNFGHANGNSRGEVTDENFCHKACIWAEFGKKVCISVDVFWN